MNNMKIQYASDLHLEFADNWRYLKAHPLEVTGDILLLAGDIGYLGDDNYSKHPFWDWASENYKEVHCCMGNHEFYKYYDVATLPDGYLLEIRPNVFSHYNGVVRIGDTDIILSTLWSRIPLEDAYFTEQVISDFRRILYKGELMTHAQFNAEHKRCLTFIKDAVAHSQAVHKIVVTHHVPSFRMLHPKFQGSKANGAFTVELEDYITDSGIDYWIYGHSHTNINARIGNTKFDASKAVDRKIKNLKEGFWWVELGSPKDIIADREKNRHDLMAYFYGVWDYVKNSGEYPEAANLALEWVGSLPGKRESRRFMGDYILTEKDLLSYKHFDDAVAWGGWSLDEHCPGGILSLDQRPSYFHERFKKVYEIPYRCLYSKNVPNLMFAGRNVSVSHMALSSTRIIGTCCMMGQAVGVATAMCIEKNINPREIYLSYIDELQERMLRNDYYIPNRPANDSNDLTRTVDKVWATSTSSGDVHNLFDGVARDEENKIHHWQSDGLNEKLFLEWKKPVEMSSVEIKFDTNLHRKIMMHKNPAKNFDQVPGMPPELVKTFSVDVYSKGRWHTVGEITDNIKRFVPVSFPAMSVTKVRINLKETYGCPHIRLYEVRCY